MDVEVEVDMELVLEVLLELVEVEVVTVDVLVDVDVDVVEVVVVWFLHDGRHGPATLLLDPSSHSSTPCWTSLSPHTHFLQCSVQAFELPFSVPSSHCSTPLWT